MRLHRDRSEGRRGAIVPLAALLAALMIGMLAFAIDTGYMVAVRAELQNAADAGALAGAQRLQEPFVQFYAPGQTKANQQSIYDSATTDTTTSTSPICTAQKFASSNKAGNVSVTVPTSDISFTYWDGTNAPVAAGYPSDFPNSVTVVARRDATANGALNLFFGPVLGVSSVGLTAKATATMYAGDVSSLQVIPGVNAHILPVAYDYNFWMNFAKPGTSTTGQSPDGKTYLGSNGLPQLQVYPDFKDAPGAFGLLDVGTPANNTPAFRSWIDNGETPNDIKYLVDNKLVPVSTSSPQAWKCGPGLKSTLVSNFQSVMGDTNLLPLFKPVVAYGTPGKSYQAADGTGQNTTFEIVGFVGVTVSQADGSGNANMSISVQPIATLDPTALVSNPKPVTASTLTQFGTYQTTFISAKLTQ
jgi:Flp pilus assembly protein TadG